MEYVYRYRSPLGEIIMESSGTALTGLRFDDQKRDAKRAGDAAQQSSQDGVRPGADALPVFRRAKEWLDIYFSGRDPGFTPEIELTGTAFQKTVWEILLTIPYGTTTTYGEIAKILSQRKASVQGTAQGTPAGEAGSGSVSAYTGGCRVSAQAVGGAVARNPISLIVPCHRVIGADGSLTGYAWGLARKAALLELENGRGESCLM